MIKTIQASNFPDLSTPVVMGILNITPDSFYDGGHYISHDQWLGQAERMLRDGASIIDIGGASTRPGAKEIDDQEEWRRVEPAIKSIRDNFPGACISVDTFHSSVAEKALESGATMINDISGGTFDNNMAAVIAKYQAPYVIMHIQGRPGNMQDDPHYDNVVNEVYEYLESRIKLLLEHGAEQLIIDPGFGFGKSVEHNYELLGKLASFKDLGYPIMTGFSRKSMVNRVLGAKPDQALNGTTVLNTIALMNGADILRVHDVKEAVEAIKLTGMLK